MKDSGNSEQPGWFYEPTFDLTEDINGVRDGIADIRKGVASLFLKQSGEGTQLINDGIHYIQEGVSRIREKLSDEELVSSESRARVLSGIEAELEAVALLNEGLKSFLDNRFAQGTQNIVQGLYLAENGLTDIAEAGDGADLRERQKVVRSLQKNVLILQTVMRDVADGLDDIQVDSIEAGIQTIEAATEDIPVALEMIEDGLQSLCNENPEHLRLIIEGVQAVGEGRTYIRSGLTAVQTPRSDESCPVCLCVEQIEKSLLHLRDGIRDMKRGIQLLQQDKAFCQ